MTSRTCEKIASEVTVRGEGGVQLEKGELVVHENFIQVHAINEYQLRLDVQRFLWPVY